MHRPAPRMYTGALAIALLGPSACLAQEETTVSERTVVAGIKLGHFTLDERPTGCTVLLAEEGAVGGVDVRGGAPGTRETDLLDPSRTVQEVHAVVLSGGSAYGLDAASGVMRYLEERDFGYRVGSNVVPIVTGAILYDLGVGDPSVRPGSDCGYQAASVASVGGWDEGSVGAGAGATVGKLRGMARAMKGGIGVASLTLESGVTIAAVMAVNAVGDVIDPATGRVVAGVRTEDGTALADARRLVRDGVSVTGSRTNTTIGVVVTDATLDQAQATTVARMAHDGLARAVYPAHTPRDGDAIFALATGEAANVADLFTLGTLAADVVAEAIVRAVRSARGLPGLPSASELSGVR